MVGQNSEEDQQWSSEQNKRTVQRERQKLEEKYVMKVR